MRIPFPERVPINRTILFTVAFFAIQRLEGTDLFFATGCGTFILLTAFAFNAAGGLTRASGAYVFFYSVLVVLIGIFYKAFIGEPAQSNLLDPQTDIEVYVGGMAAMLAAVIVSRRFSRKQGLLQNVLKESEMYRASVGCLVVGFAVPFLLGMLGPTAALAQTAFNQLNQFIPLGIIIGVMYEIRRSGGRRSINLPIVLGAAYYFFVGVLAFSKQGMLTPFYCWVVPVCALRFRLSVIHILSSALFIAAVFYYLVPYAQYGRSFVMPGQTFSQSVELASNLLEHPDETRQHYLASQAEQETGALGEYYDRPQGFWDRLQFIAVDDSLVNITDQGHVFGLLPLKLAFINAIPHFFWPNKPTANLGMMFVYEIEGIPEADYGETTTGISFSPTSEAYHMEKWAGVLVIAPLIWFVLFVMFDSLFGDLRATPWGLLAMSLISHTAPEAALDGVIHLFTVGTEILVFCAIFATWFAPVVAVSVLGPDRRRTTSLLSFGSAPRVTS